MSAPDTRLPFDRPCALPDCTAMGEHWHNGYQYWGASRRSTPMPDLAATPGIPLRMLESAPADMDDWQPGMMWPLELLDAESAGFSVVLCRHQDAAGHDWPIVWHTRQMPQDGPRWDVTGTPPHITVSPSINVIGVWHGFIRDGVILDA